MLRLRAMLAGSLLLATTAAAQVSSPAPAAEGDTVVIALKSPTTARLIGIIPGAGHMYAGEVGRGFLYLGGVLGILVVGGLAGVTDCLNEMFVYEEPDCGDNAAVTVSLIAAGGLWVWSIYDAGRAARRTNAERARRLSLILEPTRTPVALGPDRTAVRLGLRIRTW